MIQQLFNDFNYLSQQCVTIYSLWHPPRGPGRILALFFIRSVALIAAAHNTWLGLVAVKITGECVTLTCPSACQIGMSRY